MFLGTCTHVILRLILTCSMGLTSRMCLARDALDYVMRFGVVRFMLTSILDGKICF